MDNDIKNLYARSNVASRYALWNTAVFIAIILSNFIFKFILGYNFDLMDFLSLPPRLGELMWQPWSLFTYMFTHVGFLHFLFNMLWLYFGGRILLEISGRMTFIKTYWLGGLVGALLFVVLYNFVPDLKSHTGHLLGASGAVYAVWVTAAALNPRYMVQLPFIGPVKLMYIAAAFVVLNLPGEVLVRQGNVGGHFCHLGGVLFGYYYGRSLAQQKDPGAWFEGIHASVLRAFEKRKEKPAKMKVVKGGKYSRDDKVYNAQKKAAQDELDAILDKVGRSGYDSLSKKEKAVLNDFGKKKD